MNYLDIILAIPLLWAIFQGFRKGLIFSVASLLALILAVYGSIHYSGLLRTHVNNMLHPDERYLSVLTFSLCFIFIVIIVYVVAWLADRLIKAVALGIVNRLAGVIFNIIKVAFILSILLSILSALDRFNTLIAEKTREESILYKPIASFAPSVFPYLNFSGKGLWKNHWKIEKPEREENKTFEENPGKMI